MGAVAVSGQVSYRSDMGRFIAACEAAATATVETLIQEGATISRHLAPVKTGTLAGSIHPRMISSTSGVWETDVSYALHQEFGTKEHEITGFVNFFWEREGRDWEPGENMIQHPGNPAVHYLRNAYQAVWPRALRVAATKYPG